MKTKSKYFAGMITSVLIYMVFVQIPLGLANSGLTVSKVNSNETFRMNAFQGYPDTYGNYATWLEEASVDDPTSYNDGGQLILKNLSNNQESLVSNVMKPTTSGGTVIPKISDKLVVWASGDEIMTYDIATSGRKKIYSSNGSYGVGNPSLSNGLIAWTEYDWSDTTVKLYNIATKVVSTLTKESDYSAYSIYTYNPAVSESYVAWMQYFMPNSGGSRYYTIWYYDVKAKSKKNIYKTTSYINYLSVNVSEKYVTWLEQVSNQTVIKAYDIKSKKFYTLKPVQGDYVTSQTLSDTYIFWNESGLDANTQLEINRIYGMNLTTLEKREIYATADSVDSLSNYNDKVVFNVSHGDDSDIYSASYLSASNAVVQGAVGVFALAPITELSIEKSTQAHHYSPVASNGNIYWIDDRNYIDPIMSVYSRNASGDEYEVFATSDISRNSSFMEGDGFLAWTSYYDNLFHYDLNTSEQKIITTSIQSRPQSDGNYIVWDDYSGVNLFNNGTGTTSQIIASTQFGWIYPDISGGKLAAAGRYDDLNGGIFASISTGDSWVKINNGLSIYGNSDEYLSAIAISPQFSSDRSVYSAVNNTLYGSTTAGLSWTDLNNYPGDDDIKDIQVSPNFSSDKTVFVGDSEGMVYKSTNRGGAWVSSGSGLPSDDEVSSISISPNYISDKTVFVGYRYGSGVYKTTNAGTSWVAVNSGLDADIYDLVISPSYTSDKTLFAATKWDGIYKTTNSGSSWVRVYSCCADFISLAISPSYASDSTVYAGSDEEGIYKTTNKGTTWSAINIGIASSDSVTTIKVSPNYNSDKTVFAGTNRAGVFRSTNSGGSWSAVNNGVTNNNVTELSISPSYATDKSLYVGTQTSDEKFAIVARSISSDDPTVVSNETGYVEALQFSGNNIAWASEYNEQRALSVINTETLVKTLINVDYWGSRFDLEDEVLVYDYNGLTAYNISTGQSVQITPNYVNEVDIDSGVIVWEGYDNNIYSVNVSDVFD